MSGGGVQEVSGGGVQEVSGEGCKKCPGSWNLGRYSKRGHLGNDQVRGNM